MMRFACCRREDGPLKPVIGVLCCNEIVDRPIQAVATRFVKPLVRYAGATVLLVPAVADAMDTRALAGRLDGLLLTGSRSNVAGARYGKTGGADDALDLDRDAVALELAGRMIEAGRPVFGICRGLQELNVLFGGTLTDTLDDGHHRQTDDATAYETLFDHVHDVTVAIRRSTCSRDRPTEHFRHLGSPARHRSAGGGASRRGPGEVGRAGRSVLGPGPVAGTCSRFSGIPNGTSPPANRARHSSRSSGDRFRANNDRPTSSQQNWTYRPA